MTLNLDEIEARAKAATAGPWYVVYGDDEASMNMTMVSTGDGDEAAGALVAVTLLQSHHVVAIDDDKWDENAEFIAASITDIPALIARVRELEAERVALIDFMLHRVPVVIDGYRQQSTDEILAAFLQERAKDER